MNPAMGKLWRAGIEEKLGRNKQINVSKNKKIKLRHLRQKFLFKSHYLFKALTDIS